MSWKSNTVDGPAKSESPVETGGLYIPFLGFQNHSNHPNLVIYRISQRPIHRITSHLQWRQAESWLGERFVDHSLLQGAIRQAPMKGSSMGFFGIFFYMIQPWRIQRWRFWTFWRWKIRLLKNGTWNCHQSHVGIMKKSAVSAVVVIKNVVFTKKRGDLSINTNLNNRARWYIYIYVFTHDKHSDLTNKKGMFTYTSQRSYR